jgi:hypothetical protein
VDGARDDNISRARPGGTDLGESENMTTPMASAPQSSATRASSTLVIPQTFTRIQTPPDNVWGHEIS